MNKPGPDAPAMLAELIAVASGDIALYVECYHDEILELEKLREDVCASLNRLLGQPPEQRVVTEADWQLLARHERIMSRLTAASDGLTLTTDKVVERLNNLGL